jgi:protein gp37
MSTIEWTDETVNPIVGCSKISPGCQNCYAANAAKSPRLQQFPQYQKVAAWDGTVEFVESQMLKVLKWKKPKRIFVCSMADIFHKNVPDEWLDKIFAYMAIANHHTYQILTKRPERMAEYFTVESANRVTTLYHQLLKDGVGGKIKQDWVERHCTVFQIDEWWPLNNVWLGVSVENQKAADSRIPILLETPAKVRFLSCEPLLGEVNLSEYLEIDCYVDSMSTPDGSGRIDIKPINLIIAGGESGPNARVCHVEHLRSLVQQCQEAEVPVFVKQLGKLPLLNNGPYKISDRKGGIFSEFPEDLEVREFPQND